jgi:UDPglucose--hexose-1-phosphate uridylyltransferase
LDLIRGKWVVISTDFALKPADFPINRNGSYISNNRFCPFCEGREEHTTPEVAACRAQDSLPNSPGWDIRAVPSKYTAFKLEGQLHSCETGLLKSCSGPGQHEVIIETPCHDQELHQFSDDRMEKILTLIRQRYLQLAEDERIKYIQVYKNRGLFSGASLEHSHSQIIGIPVVPNNTPGLTKYYSENNKCLICSIIEEEKAAKQRIVYESLYFLIICPYASRFSYESWIIPKEHAEHFSDITDAQLKDLAHISIKFLKAMVDSLDNPSYNMGVNNAPVNILYEKGYHWYIEITPRLMVTNGLELATGLYINPAAPELAASIFREAMGL